MNTLCCVLLLINLTTAVRALAPPLNLSLQTLNTQYVLLWDWAADLRSSMNETPTFTAQYLPAYQTRKGADKQNWGSVCVDVSERRCDFTNADLNYFGLYCLRVRANTAQSFSSWTSIDFCPDKEANLGPPSSVRLTAVKGDLQISIADPMSSRNQSMRTNEAQDMYFLIQFWKETDGSQKPVVLKTKNNVVTLSELDSWTQYCVRVQSCYDFYNKASVFSETQCTSTKGSTLYWQILLYFLLSLLLCFLLPLLVWFCFYKMFLFLKSVFYPNVHLPHHLQELWSCDPETPPQLLPPPQSSACESVALIGSETDNKATSSGSEEQDGSGASRHSSGDSGFSSMEEDCSHTHTHTVKPTHHTHTGPKLGLHDNVSAEVQ
ncbi:interleukin-10 receptor subunit beta isoform X2 [Pseudorasbora parva]|uniref:interleukin-10 receptor subunit beta isoform X1 n=1 Tax=Pseudorasbora parva TaxID=51549 RepID=UPI00351E7C5E